MSILSKNSSSAVGGTPFFHEFKKQASFFFKEKIKTARLALTDVTPAQLLTEEATNGNSWAPDARTLGSISRAAFELDDYLRIVEILHKRLSKFDRKNWRVSYNSVLVLEHLLTHGPESAAEEFQADRDVIAEMQSFQYIDEKGFNWGLTVRKKSERILKLLEKGPVLKEERDRARKLTRGIKGFGSFLQRSSSTKGILHDSSSLYGRCNSQYENQENQLSEPVDGGSLIQKLGNSQKRNEDAALKSENKLENLESSSFGDEQEVQVPEFQKTCKENVAPDREEVHKWTAIGESNPLLGGMNEGIRTGFLMENDHPLFNNSENHMAGSLLSA
ncbi:hypothetical protein SLA2020_393960 [Shorea laevis]